VAGPCSTPAAGTGAVGDFYIDTAAHALYGPKSASGWGGSTSLIGPSTGVAGGDLTGAYPNPTLKAGAVTTTSLAAGARGAALAGVVVSSSGAVSTYFNRMGGGPTVTHVATGSYEIAFPGFDNWYVTAMPVATRRARQARRSRRR